MSGKIKKRRIPPNIRIKVWERFCGKSIYGKCFVCEENIDFQNWDCAHILSEKNGGTTNIFNLRPTCRTCNNSCGTDNLLDFRMRNYPQKSCWIIFRTALVILRDALYNCLECTNYTNQ